MGGVEQQGAELVKKTKAVFQFEIKDAGADGKWVIDLKNGNGKVFQGDAEKADCTITISDADFVAMSEGKLQGPQAFMQGKLKLKRHMLLAQKLGGVLESAKPK